jgi:NAD(P)-dependent dehydrogenase (short-subunit alcohol dehydrogenase family)
MPADTALLMGQASWTTTYSTSKPIVLIFDVGPRTGTFIANKFAGVGYQVAATGRSVGDGPVRDRYLNIKADLTDPTVVPDVFAKVKAHFGTPSNVVVYNGTRPNIPSEALKIVSAK